MNSPTTDRVNLFAKLLVEHQPRLYRYVRMLMPDDDNAADVLQETFTVMWQKFDETCPEGGFYGWGCRIAHFIALRERRSTRRRVAALDPEILEQIAIEESDDPEFMGNVRMLLEACMAELPAGDRELIQERYQPGVFVTSLAEKLKRPRRSVSKSLARIRRTLLKCLSKAMSLQTRKDDRRLP